MSREQNKKLVGQFLERFSASDVSGVNALLHDAIVWKVMGREGVFHCQGKWTKPL